MRGALGSVGVHGVSIGLLSQHMGSRVLGFRVSEFEGLGVQCFGYRRHLYGALYILA